MSGEEAALGMLDRGAVARRWGCCERTVVRLAEQWGLPAIRLGHRTVRYRLVDVIRAEARMVGQADESTPKRGRPRGR